MHPSARYTLVGAPCPAIPHCPAIERLLHCVEQLHALASRSHAEVNLKIRGVVTSEGTAVPHVRCNFAPATSLLRVRS